MEQGQRRRSGLALAHAADTAVAAAPAAGRAGRVGAAIPASAAGATDAVGRSSRAQVKTAVAHCAIVATAFAIPEASRVVRLQAAVGVVAAPGATMELAVPAGAAGLETSAAP
jgi:hypothetical protein